MKRLFSYTRYAIRYNYICQCPTTIERTIAYNGHAISYGYVRQAATTIERAFSYVRYTVRYIYRSYGFIFKTKISYSDNLFTFVNGRDYNVGIRCGADARNNKSVFLFAVLIFQPFRGNIPVAG